MVRVVTAAEAIEHIKELMESIKTEDDLVLIVDAGKEIAVLAHPDESEQLKRARLAELRSISEKWVERTADLDPDEAYERITRAVEKVRQELYEEDVRATSGGS
jgi:PHD/YefM family antitoxin component YafN of YafNO toxin-antitoxin module